MTGPAELSCPATMLRMSGLSTSLWLAGAAPELTALLRELDRLGDAYRRAAERVAAEIGGRLVGLRALTTEQRADALRLRRVLHNGGPIPAAASGVADTADRTLPASDPLAGDIRELVRTGAELAVLRERAEHAMRAEEQRLLAAPWGLLHDSPAGRHALRGGDVTIYQDIAARVAVGEPWTTKRMRQRSDYLWRMIARGSTRATPRGWLAHVALVPVTPDGWSGDRLSIKDQAAAEYVENVHLRAATDELRTDDAGVVVLPAPLVCLEPHHIRVWTVDGQHPGRLGQARMRRTATLERVRAAVADVPRSATALVEELVGGQPERRPAIGRLLDHLRQIGVLRISTPPRAVLTAWTPVDQVVAPPDADRHGFVDVYRATATGMAASYAARLTNLIELGMRVVRMTDDDGPVTPTALPEQLGSRPRPLLDIVAECVESNVRVHRGIPHHHDWPVPRDPHSAYGRLHRWIGTNAGGPDQPSLDLDSEILSELGAPIPSVGWPVDCLVRPMRSGSGALAVLDQISPAGQLDARFATAMCGLYPDVPQLDSYRRFLRELSRRNGIRIVELLVPPMTVRAANAVRRPDYTSWWTGDPDRTVYLPDESGAGACYLPLSAITLRTDGARVVAAADGHEIWPICHTTRSASAPWDTVSALLMLASPQPERFDWRPVAYSLTGWPERDYLPRLTVGGELVLSVAQWRLPGDQLWRPGDRPTAKVMALQRLRRRLGLPRWIMAAADVHDDPIALDLDSLRTIRTVERLVSRGPSCLLFSEWLPGPGQLPVFDEAAQGHSVAELLLRVEPRHPRSHG